MATLWDDMLDEFRALGGTADNVCLKEGRFGRGLFPIDPSKPVRLHAPESLLVEIKYIAFNEDNSFRWHAKAPIGDRERAFLDAYQRDFSWGANRGHTEAMLKMLGDAPEELRALLRTPFGVDLWLGGPTQAAIRDRYFASRFITYKGSGVLMPVVELVNHSPTGITFDREDGIGIAGLFDDEILVRYRLTDALDLFRNWGFASTGQPFALSLELNQEIRGGELVIERGEVSTDPKRRLFYPDVKVNGGGIVLSHLLLGHKDYPKLAKANFYRIMKNAGRSDGEEIFDRIAYTNKTEFLKLMAVSEQSAPATGKIVRDVARTQLEALSCAIGAREL